jgi:hypothetical protein
MIGDKEGLTVVQNILGWTMDAFTCGRVVVATRPLFVLFWKAKEKETERAK